MFEFFKNVTKKITTQNEYVLGLLLKEEEGTALFLRKDDQGRYHLVDEVSFEYTNAWERLVNDVDEALFRLEQKYKTHVSKVIFFLFSHLTDSKGSVKKPYLKHLKEVVSANELEVLGFIEQHEAIASYLAKKEQTGLTAVIIEVDSPAISVFLYQGGEKTFSGSIAKTHDLISDVKQIFEGLPKDTMLPPRIILYNSSTHTAESTSIVTNKWSDDLFIQIPKVEVFMQEDLYKALVFAFYTQNEDISSFTVDSRSVSEDLVRESNDKELIAAPGGAPFGFVVGEDIATIKETDVDTVPDESGNASERQEDIVPSDQHDHESEVVNPDSSKQDQDDMWQKDVQPLSESQDNGSEYEHEYEEPVQKSRSPGFATTIFVIRQKIIRFFGGHRSARVPLILLIGFFLVIGALFCILYFLHTATLTLFYKTDRIEKEVQLDNTDITIDADKKTLSEKASTSTSGEQDVGEKATGQVTLYNADESEKTFPKATVLSTSDGKNFLLESDIKVASSSKQLTNEGNLLTITGKSKGQALAEKIGEEYNVAKNTRFSVAKFSQNLYYAIAELSFTGGKKRKAQTVSKEDIARLRKEVEKKMNEKQQKDLSTKASDIKLVSPLTDFSIEDESFSAEAGEEARTLTLVSKANIQYFTYSEKDMKDTLRTTLQSSVPEGYTLESNDITYRIIDAQNRKNKISLSVKAVLRPQYDINKKELYSKIKGKSVSDVKSILKSEYNVTGYELDVASDIPFLNTIVPLFDKNITVIIRSL